MDKWTAITQSIMGSSKTIKTINVNNDAAYFANTRYNLSPESTLGVVINHCGGIVIDNWIRIYGAGEIDICNKNDLYEIDNIIAEDIIGGLFLLDENSKIGYFAPDTLEIENLKISYSQFLYWCIQGDTDLFYKDFRWKNWKNEAESISYNEGILFYPFLYTQADCIDARDRKFISMSELVNLELEMQRKLQGKHTR